MSTNTLFNLARSYLLLAGLLSVSALVLSLIVYGVERFEFRMRFSGLLKISKTLILASILLPMVMVMVPKQSLMKPSAQIWSGDEKRATPEYALLTFNKKSVDVRSPVLTQNWVISERTLFAFLILLFFGSIFQSVLFFRRYYRLKNFLKLCPVIKQLGRICLLASSDVQSPFSNWTPSKSFVVFPTEFLTQPKDLKIALNHEIQHHRSGDTQWVYVLEVLKILFFWNPFINLLSSRLNEIQEFACDEFLIGHRKISPHAYGSCLVRAAESAVHSQLIWVGTTCMAESLSSTILKRRIDMLFRKKQSVSRLVVLAIAVGALSVLGSLAYASQSAIQDRKLTLEEAKIYARKASEGTQIPIEMNDLVLNKLNYYIGNPQGRKWARESMLRMANYQSMINSKTAQYGLPSELIAVALGESGFNNSALSAPPYLAAGIWQFVAPTARNYHLTVTPTLDERLNPEKETDAAMEYLSFLFATFQDWRLALKAYNQGEHHILQMIEQYGTRDAWVFERNETSQEGYLANSIAMVILLKNPSLLN